MILKYQGPGTTRIISCEALTTPQADAVMKGLNSTFSTHVADHRLEAVTAGYEARHVLVIDLDGVYTPKNNEHTFGLCGAEFYLASFSSSTNDIKRNKGGIVEVEKVQQAVKFNDVFVTVGDIIVIKPQRYINSRERSNMLENNGITAGTAFSARVCSIGPAAFEVDASKRYESRRFSMRFEDILKVELVGDKEVADC